MEEEDRRQTSYNASTRFQSAERATDDAGIWNLQQLQIL